MFGPEERTHTHDHDYRIERMADGVFRLCTGCGDTHVLWRFDDGTYGWLRVAAQDEYVPSAPEEETTDEAA